MPLFRDGEELAGTPTQQEPQPQQAGALPPRSQARQPSSYDSIIQSASAEYGIDPDLVRAVIGQESGGRYNAVSNKGAGGLMQLMPATAKRFGVQDRFDPEQNIRGGTAYLAYLHDRYSGDTQRVLAAYNAGEGAVDRHGGIPPYKETQAYVPSVLARYKKLKGEGGSAGLHPGLIQPGEWEDLGSPQSQQSGDGPTWEDRGRALMSGFANIPTTIGTGMEMAGRGLGWEPLEDIGHSVRRVGKEAEDWWRDGMTSEGQNPTSLWDKITQSSLESIPGMITMAIPAMGAAGMMARLGAGTAVSGMVPSALSEGVFSALQNAAQSGDEARNAPQTLLEQHPLYQRALEMAGGNADVARESVARAAETSVFQKTLPWTAITSALTGGGVLGALAGRTAGAASKGLLREVGENIVKEGAQEAVQSGGEQFIQNTVAQENYDLLRQPMQGVGEAVIVGGGAGALLGGGFGAVSNFGRNDAMTQGSGNAGTPGSNSAVPPEGQGGGKPSGGPTVPPTQTDMPQFDPFTKQQGFVGETDLLNPSASQGALTIPNQQGTDVATRTAITPFEPRQQVLEGELVGGELVPVQLAGALPYPSMEGETIQSRITASRALPGPETQQESSRAIYAETSSGPDSGSAPKGERGITGGKRNINGGTGKRIRGSSGRSALGNGNDGGVAGQRQSDANQLDAALTQEEPIAGKNPPEWIPDNLKPFAEKAAQEETDQTKFRNRVRALTQIKSFSTEQAKELNDFFNSVKNAPTKEAQSNEGQEGQRQGRGRQERLLTEKAGAQAPAIPKASEHEVIEVNDIYGRTIRVRKSDLEGNSDRLSTVRKNGEIWSGDEVPRKILKNKKPWEMTKRELQDYYEADSDFRAKFDKAYGGREPVSQFVYESFLEDAVQRQVITREKAAELKKDSDVPQAPAKQTKPTTKVNAKNDLVERESQNKAKTEEAPTEEGKVADADKESLNDAKTPERQDFTPTHELPDGTPVVATDEPNVWRDAKGEEWEDEEATPIRKVSPAKPPTRTEPPPKGGTPKSNPPVAEVASERLAQKESGAQPTIKDSLTVEKQKATPKQAVELSRMRATAKKLIEDAQARQNRDRNTNTARRARMAAGALDDAAKDEALGKTMLKIADAIEAGEAPHLAGVNTKSVVETLRGIQTSAIYESDKDIPYVDRQKRKGRPFEDTDLKSVQYPEPLKATYDHMKSELEAKKKRLQRAGIMNLEDLRAAIKEFSELQSAKRDMDPIKKAEMALVGQKVGVDYFPTPKPLASRMADMADIKEGMTVLEPSAGNGNLADAAKAAGANVEVVEISDALRKVLEAKGYKIVDHDFNGFDPDKQYDAILMNPPFSNNQDAEHIQRAYKMLKPGGKLVAIAGEGVFFRGGKKETAFREWLEEVGAEVEKLPANTFMDKSLQATTGVNARLIKVEKPQSKTAPNDATTSERNDVSTPDKKLDERTESPLPSKYGPEVSQGLETAQDFVKRWAKLLGIDDVPVVMDDTITVKGQYIISNDKAKRVIKLHPTILARLASSNKMMVTDSMEVVAHEFGHHVAEVYLAAADEATKAAVAKDYADWFKAQYGKSLQEMFQSRMPPMQGRNAALASTEALRAAGMNEEYALDQAEWLADNAARYLLKLEMQGVTQPETKSLIKQIADKLKQMWESVKGSLKVQKSVEDFLNGLLERNAEKIEIKSEMAFASKSANALDMRSPGEMLQTAQDVFSDIISTPGTFNFLDKTILTQFHKAMKSPVFGKFWRRTHQMFQNVNRAISRPADLAPTILPKFDISNWTDAVKAVFGKEKASAADFQSVHDVLMAGTLAGDGSPMSGHLFTDAELQGDITLLDGRTIRLTPMQRQIFKEARNAIDASIQEAAAAQAWVLARLHVANDELREFVAENPIEAPQALDGALQLAQEELEEEIGILETSDLSKNKEGVTVDALKQQVKSIESTRTRLEGIFDKADALKKHGYMPAHRFGQYRVMVTNDNMPEGQDPLRYVEHFETHVEANRARREILKKFPASKGYTVSGVTEMDQDRWKLFRGVNPDTVMLFAEEAGVPTDEVMQEWYKEAVSNHSALARLAHRHGYAGYSKDLPRSLATFVTSNGKFAGNAYHMADLQKAAQEEKAGDIAAEERKLLETINNDSGGNDFASKARGLMAAWYLLGSPAAAIVNATQPITMSGPWMVSKGAKIGHAYKLLAKAYQQIRSGKYDKTLKEAIARAENDGTIAASEVYHLYQESMKPLLARIGGGEISRKTQALMFLWGAPFSMAEQLNRKATFIAAFNLAREKGMEADEAFRFAEQGIIETQGIYALHNRPNWSREGIGALAFTFKQFTISYLEMLTRMAKSGPDGRRAAGLQLAVLFFFSGLLGAPGEEDLEDAIDTLAQTIFGKAFVSRVELRKALEGTLGKEMAGFVQHGVSEFLPFDIGARLGVGNLIPGTAVLKPSEKNAMREFGQVFGPAGSTVNNIIDASRMLLNDGDILRAMRMAAPKAVGDVIKGVEMAATGEARDNYGAKVVNASKLDALFQGIGLQPSSKAKEAAVRYPLQELIGLRNKMESEIAGRMARGMVDNDYQEVAKARRKLQEWNRSNPSWKIEITARQLRSRVKNLSRSRAEQMVKSAAPEIRGNVAAEVGDEGE